MTEDIVRLKKEQYRGMFLSLSEHKLKYPTEIIELAIEEAILQHNESRIPLFLDPETSYFMNVDLLFTWSQTRQEDSCDPSMCDPDRNYWTEVHNGFTTYEIFSNNHPWIKTMNWKSEWKDNKILFDQENNLYLF